MNKNYYLKQILQNQEKDKIRDSSLLEMGWKTIRMHYSHTPTYNELEKDFLQKVKLYISR